MKTHYEILGVPRDADQRTIRSAYRRLVLEHHPDRSRAPDAHDRFVTIVRAYEVLSDPERRAAYDRLLDVRKSGPTRSAIPTPGPAGRVPSARPNDARTVVRSNLEDVRRISAYLSRGQFLEAERYARQMIAQEPRQALPYAVLADVHRIRGEIKKAAEMYAYAAQMDPENRAYQEKHEQMLRAMSQIDPERIRQESPASVPAFAVGVGVICACAAYLALSPEKPWFESLPPISTWTLGLVVMLFLSGVAIGATMSLSGLLGAFGAAGGSVVARISPTLALALVAIVNFWAAAALYVVIGASQDVFNESTSRFMAGVAAVLCTLALASGFSGIVNSGQVLLWGGNLVYLGALIGWMVADGMRPA